MSIDVTNLKAASAGTIAMALDAKDGKSDGKISASIWNEFVADKGGKTIQNSINLDNAIKSISTYLARNAESMKENVNNLASNWLAKIVVPKENENEAVVAETTKEEVEEIEDTEVWADAEVTEDTERLTRLNDTVKKADAYARSRRNGNEGITISASVLRDVVYVDMGQDGNYDIAYDLEGNKIMDLTEGAEPPKGYAKKSVWYNPLTWF